MAQDVSLFIDDRGPPASHGTKASFAPASGALVPMTPQAPVSNAAPVNNRGLIYSGPAFFGCACWLSRKAVRVPRDLGCATTLGKVPSLKPHGKLHYGLTRALAATCTAGPWELRCGAVARGLSLGMRVGLA